ncbi:MAG TPA: MFS transporter [Actinocrinis sp.]|nr:MFS transporter [Actinocrinis sp.]
MTGGPQAEAGRARQARDARIAVGVVFFANGALFGNWVLRIPAIKDHIHADTGPLGLALLCLAGGALLSKPVSGQLVTRYGSGPITRLGITLTCLALMLPALAVNVATLALALAGFGAALGILDVAMNAHGVAVQARLGRPVMSSLHGMFSVGGLLGSLAAGGAAARGWPPLPHFAVVAAVLGGASLVASFRLLPASCDVAPKTAQGGWAKLPADLRRPLVLLGMVALCGMMAEGAVGDWGAIYLHGNLGTSTAVAALGYSAYSVAMAVGRFLGDRCLARWGEARVVTRAATVAGGAFALGLLAGQPAAAVCGFTVLGIGLAIVTPAIFSMAGRMGGQATGPAITVVSGIGGTGMLAGPPLIGFIAQATGLPAALGGISVLTVSAALLLRLATAGHRAAPGLAPAAASASDCAPASARTAEHSAEPTAEPVP